MGSRTHPLSQTPQDQPETPAPVPTRPRKPLQHNLLLCQRAGELLKRAGFVVMNVSMKTEAVYYRFPGRVGSIRVAAHKSDHGKSSRRRPYGPPVLAKLTFRGDGAGGMGVLRLSDIAFFQRIWIAIGKYLTEADFEDVERHDGRRAEGGFPCGDAGSGD